MAADRSVSELERFLAERADHLLRRAVRSPFGKPGSLETADITRLPPTAQNLAKLTVPIPAGFRQVPLSEADMPILKQIPGVQPRKPKAPCPAQDVPACKNGPALPTPA